MELNEISGEIIDAAIEVHKELGGPGLLESIYEEALATELSQRGLKVERQKTVPVVYKGRRLATDFRIDLLAERQVIVECKAAAITNPVCGAQVLTYLRLLDLKLGLVVNFGKRRVSDGIHRVVNGL
jgi:GxxExxY protein